MRRGLATVTTFFATGLLTAAVFLLPATGERRQAQAAVDEIKVSATHIDYDAAMGISAARE
jgi:hypothetical protein